MKLIHERVGKLHYLSFDEFVGDFAKIHRNSKLYNPVDDDANLPEKVKAEMQKERKIATVLIFVSFSSLATCGKRLFCGKFCFLLLFLKKIYIYLQVERCVFEARRKRGTQELEKVFFFKKKLLF